MWRTHDHDITHGGIFAQGLVAQDGALDFLGTDSVAGYVYHVVRTTVQGECSVIVLTRIVSLRVGQFTIPSVEIDLTETVNVPAPAIFE